MHLRISFSKENDGESKRRIVFEVGEVIISSYPRSLDDHYRDLAANMRFLSERRLASLFLGEEPLAEVNMQKGSDLVQVLSYSRIGTKRKYGEFLLTEGLSYMRGILDGIAAAIQADQRSLQLQVSTDIEQGVYNIYLRDYPTTD